MQTEYLIIGGGVAGVTAAETIRAADKQAKIHIVSDEPHRLYSRIMLSKPSFFLGKIPFDRVYLKTEQWAKENNIKYIFGQTATGLDAQQKIVTLSGGEKVGYKKLLLALGCNAIRWNIPGAEKVGVCYLRNLDDARGVIDDVQHTKRAIVIGGGFIGFEMCDMLKMAGLETTLIIREKYFWEPLLDEVSGRMIEAALKKGGVNILYETLVEKVRGDGRVTGVKLNNGTTLPTDMIIVGIGTKSPTEWVSQGGITCNRGVIANKFLQTSDPDVYTAGDVAEYEDTILGEQIMFGNWVNAQLQGKIAALNMLGTATPYRHASFYTAQGLGTAIVFTGDIRVTLEREVLQRGSPEAHGYTRIITQDGKIKGATMINRTADLMPLTKIIELGSPVEPIKDQLVDVDFDLKQLIVKTA